MTDNNRTKRTLEFDLSDAPMLVHAFAIAATTAWMCGHHDARERLNEYRKFVALFSPPEAQLFGEEEWAEMGMALVGAKSFHVWITKQSEWLRGHHVSPHHLMVQIGDKKWVCQVSWVLAGVKLEQVKAVRDALQEIAPMDCVGTYEGQP